MRVVVINATTDLYGSNRILSLALRGLPDSAATEVWLPVLEGPFIELLRENNPNVEIRKCDFLPIIQRSMFSIKGMLHLVILILKFYGYVRRERERSTIDLIYINTLSNFFVLPVARFMGIKSILHIHEILEQPKLVAKFISILAIRWADEVLCVSQAVKKGLENWQGAPLPLKVTVIHNGIPSLYIPQRAEVRDDKVLVTLIARIMPEKGIWYFLDALKEVKSYNSIRARIIGGPAPMRENYIDLLKEDILKLKVNVEYIPFVNDVRDYLNQTDILVVPSLMKDPFPTTVLEGLSCGKVVLATNNGGASEVIQNYVNGILIAPHDPTEFARSLDVLAADKSLREKLGGAGKITFEEEYSDGIYLEKLRHYFTVNLASY
jgi:glycosyltransferase involved in cell wall biosynthesis